MLESVRFWAYRIGLPTAIPRESVNLLIVLFIAGALAFLAVTYGALPVLNARALNQVGIAKCAADSGNIFATSCEQIGYPIGFSPLVGYPVQVFLAFLYKYLSVPLIDGIQIFTLLSLALGFVALFSLVRRYTSSTVAAATASLVFYSSPFLLGLRGFGLPVVTTSIGVEGMDLVEGTDVLIADTPEDFARKVVQLYCDEDLWARVSANSTRYVAENYEREVVRSKMWEILSEHNLLPDINDRRGRG